MASPSIQPNVMRQFPLALTKLISMLWKDCYISGAATYSGVCLLLQWDSSASIETATFFSWIEVLLPCRTNFHICPMIITYAIRSMLQRIQLN